jgi:hypothetical protein
VTSQLDLGRFVQRRQFRSYEQDLARSMYAYGVDLRRFRWLSQSMTAQTVMRALELRWTSVAEELMKGELQVPEGAVTLPFLQEIVRITELLRLALPAVRLVGPSARGRWPVVTALGNARSSDDWLVLDVAALAPLQPVERAFLLGQALGHIQCGHAALFMAHYVSHREGGHLPVRLFLRPLSRLCAFSADRAGLLAAGEFEPAARMLARSADGPYPPWYPPLADPEERRRALEEFERTRIVARVRSSQRHAQEHPSVPELTRQLLEAAPEALPEGASAADAAAAAARPGAAGGAAPLAAGFEVPADAWPLARCDQRLTRRLGIL